MSAGIVAIIVASFIAYPVYVIRDDFPAIRYEAGGLLVQLNADNRIYITILPSQKQKKSPYINRKVLVQLVQLVQFVKNIVL